MVVHGAGQVAELMGLDYAVAGIRREDKKGVKVNEYLQSVSNPAGALAMQQKVEGYH